MKKNKLLALLVALVMLTGLIAACGDGATDTPAATTPTDDAPAQEAPVAEDSGDDPPPAATGDSDFYEIQYYRNYDWATDVWGEDLTTQYWDQKFNLTLNIGFPDSNPDEMLTLMVTSGDFPEAIWMDRNDWNRRLARDGHFIDLDTLKPMIAENWYDENILQQTQEFLKIDGVLYGIPNWARKDASGGNNGWMYTQSIYDAAGAPEITTFDDLYNYAVYVRDNITESYGQPVIPVGSESINDISGENFINGIYRSFGGSHPDGWWGTVNGEYLPLIMDPVYHEALVEANKWFREGLWSPTMLTDNRDMFLEKLSSARFGLVYYDHSQDEGLHFRKQLRAAYPGDSLELVTFQGDGMTRLYPPAHGLAPGRIYGEHYGTIGWNVTCIFNNAQHPERIFEFITYLLTKQGSIEMMYGPQGQQTSDGATLWDELNAEGNPMLNYSTADHPDRVAELALWKWTLAGHADNVDHTKFAVNDSMPEDQRNWVESHQAHTFTPLMRPLTDEYANVQAILAPDTPLQIARHTCFEYLVEKMPQILTASNEAEVRAVIQEILDFFDENSMPAIIAEHNVVFQQNVAMQGGSIFTRPGSIFD